jgi:hypothetical protein
VALLHWPDNSHISVHRARLAIFEPGELTKKPSISSSHALSRIWLARRLLANIVAGKVKARILQRDEAIVF